MAPVAPAPGDVIEDYEILEKIGGNMGFVFKARHRLLDKIVALKLFPADSIADPARLARFQRELRVMGQLEHPNLVTAADARIVRGWHLVAMELIEGMDLQRLIETRGPLPVAAACEIARQAALALQHAHQHGLIHRDIKPSNLMLTRAGTVKVIDMGLALTREEPTALLTQTGLLLGTMNYCAPEQFRDASRVDIRADIYSLGCTLYHLLAGNPPYSRRTTFAEVVQAHLNEDFPRLAEARPDAPAGLEMVLARMTAKDPGSRFATPAEVAEALEPFARGADLKQFVPAKIDQSPPVRGTTGRVPPAPGGRRTIAASDERTGMPWSRIAALLLVLLAVAGALFAAVNRKNRGSDVTTRNSVVPASDRVFQVVVIDTTADRGVYDEKNKGKGVTNGEEIRNALRDMPVSVQTEQISIHWTELQWRGEATIIESQPHAVLIHRSALFHPVAKDMNLDYPPFTNDAASNTWTYTYAVIDVALGSFLGNIGARCPGAQFLIYSRGTDPKWTNEDFRVEWRRNIEERFGLNGRVSTMWVRTGTNGNPASFRNPETAEEIRNWVRSNVMVAPKTK